MKKKREKIKREGKETKSERNAEKEIGEGQK